MDSISKAFSRQVQANVRDAHYFILYYRSIFRDLLPKRRTGTAYTGRETSVLCVHVDGHDLLSHRRTETLEHGHNISDLFMVQR